MRSGWFRVMLSLAAVVIWLAATALPGLLKGLGSEAEAPKGVAGLVDAVSSDVMLGSLLAIVVLLVIAAVLRWHDLGFNPPRPLRSVWLLWLPGVYLLLFYSAALAIGLPPVQTLGILFVNSLLVGVSEELAFRGVLFRGLRSRLGMWPSVIISSLVFGLLHVANVLTTGDFAAGLAQAAAATMTGVVMAAVVIRTGSILPAMALHALWDFGALLAVTSVLSSAGAAAEGAAAAETAAASPMLYVLPLVFNLPNFLYGLFLLRRSRTGEPAAPQAPLPAGS